MITVDLIVMIFIILELVSGLFFYLAKKYYGSLHPEDWVFPLGAAVIINLVMIPMLLQNLGLVNFV